MYIPLFCVKNDLFQHFVLKNALFSLCKWSWQVIFLTTYLYSVQIRKIENKIVREDFPYEFRLVRKEHTHTHPPTHAPTYALTHAHHLYCKICNSSSREHRACMKLKSGVNGSEEQFLSSKPTTVDSEGISSATADTIPTS